MVDGHWMSGPHCQEWFRFRTSITQYVISHDVLHVGNSTLLQLNSTELIGVLFPWIYRADQLEHRTESYTGLIDMIFYLCV